MNWFKEYNREQKTIAVLGLLAGIAIGLAPTFAGLSLPENFINPSKNTGTSSVKPSQFPTIIWHDGEPYWLDSCNGQFYIEEYRHDR